MHASVEMLRGRGTSYAGPIPRRISTTCLQNPKFFRPELRSGLKQRQEVILHIYNGSVLAKCQLENLN